MKKQKAFIVRGAQIGLLSIILIMVFTASIWNAAQLRIVLNDSTKEYLNDVTTQMSGDIQGTIQHKMTDLEELSDSVSRFDSGQDREELKEFLNRKAHIQEFDPLVVLDRNGNTVSSESELFSGKREQEMLLQMESVQSSFEGEVCASYLGGEIIVYSVPVYENGQVTGVLIGGRSKENMQRMIASKSFNGNALSCIIDSDGQVVISPEDLNPFMQLEDIFESDEKVAAGIREMQEKMRAGQDGMLKFTAVTHEELFLAYNGLGINDWILLTIIPADIISGGADRYIYQSFIIVGVTIAFFSMFLFAVFRFYNDYRKKLERAAFTDPVTGGMNNAAFQMKFREISHEIKPCTYTIVLLNVKGFKMINERFGISVGNDILRYVCRVLEHHMRAEKNEFAARSESDHFFLCIKEHAPEAIKAKLGVIIEDINSFHGVDLPCYQFSFKQGACLVEDPGMEIMLLQDRARTAYQNQSPGMQQECSFYDNSFTDKLRKEHELNELFERSVSEHHFEIYLQPKIGLGENRLEGAEALVRWNHPQRGMISPAEFIPIFERSDKICTLDFYVFKEVCMLLNSWIKEGKKPVPISVNLSRLHFLNAGFLEEFAEIAHEYEILPGMIEFELTESIFFDTQRIKTVQESIRHMHRMGFLCSLDDFGSGFSSLGLLKEFDVDTLKLDRSFFMNISDERGQEIISCLIELAGKLEVQTVAEGIETPEQLEYLRSVHCDMVQGYIFSKPLPISAFEEWSKQYI
ncbi:GGDEF domain-containing protein [Ruminococcus sp. OA3]|uniref:bifunctional diguanylate cyclase/phosphodiesterase n=1 Tax=Ruminococcus sp. OA3 TaxID=2914164 RepID=UPI001F058F61|nr:GGDEF domain-containing protein [Ruminococcus sp. OA3]MCH1981737.1 GGDEF domain-containing protein [Ruminococcus sp. OA3]